MGGFKANCALLQTQDLAGLAEDDLLKGAFSGLEVQSPHPEWQCRRRWRNGSLGFVHWASRYGYEHRRHEGEQQMNISNCTTFVLKMLGPEPAPAISSSATVCQVCCQEFESEASLAQHMQAPALPINDTCSHSCPVCGRSFASDRALQQHSESCQNRQAKKPLKSPAVGYSTSTMVAIPQKLVRVEVTIAEEEGQRLSQLTRQCDKLRGHLPSKAAAKRAIARGELTLNSEHVEESRILKAGDVVTLCLDRVRDAMDATMARARNVKMVAPKCSSSDAPQRESAAGACSWQVVSNRCPHGAAVVWKPTGMRCLGSHPGTLQSSLPLLPEMAALASPLLQPLSRLEIGCCGLSLVT